MMAQVEILPLSQEEEDALDLSVEPEWMVDVSGFRCPGCRKMLMMYSTAACGHKYCKSCQSILEREYYCLFTNCRKAIWPFDDRPDAAFELKINALSAYCRKRKYGCPEFHTIQNLYKHTIACKINDDSQYSSFLTQLARLEFKPRSISVENPKAEVKKKSEELEAEVIERVMQMRLDHHQRTAEGQFGVWVDFQTWIETRDLLEKIYIDEDPLRQTGYYKSRLLKDQIHCLQHFLGGVRRARAGQQQFPLDLMSLADYNQWLENMVFEIPTALQPDSQLNAYNLMKAYDRIQPTFQWTVPNFQSYKSEKEPEVLSEYFSCPGYAFLARAKVIFKDGWNIFATLRFYNRKDEKEAVHIWPKPRVYCCLTDGQKNKFRQMFYPGCSLRFSENKWARVDGFFSSRKIHEACFSVFVEHPFMAEQVQSDDGNLNWVIEEYSRRVEAERNGVVKYQQSPYFYTSPDGYKVQLRARLRGPFKKRAWKLTVTVCFLGRRFQYTPFPSDPLPHQLWLGLVNRTNPANSIVRCVNYEGNKLKKGKWKSYKVDLCDARVMDNFVEDDRLFINAKIIT